MQIICEKNQHLHIQSYDPISVWCYFSNYPILIPIRISHIPSHRSEELVAKYGPISKNVSRQNGALNFSSLSNSDRRPNHKKCVPFDCFAFLDWIQISFPSKSIYNLHCKAVRPKTDDSRSKCKSVCVCIVYDTIRC